MKRNWKYFIKLLGICFVLLFSLSYGGEEIPNTVIKDNPKAEITTVQTKKRKTAPAELNIEVKKIVSSEIFGSVDEEKKEIVFDLNEAGVNGEASKILTSDKLIHVTKELETYPSIATTNGRKKWSNILEKYKTAKKMGNVVENDGLTSELIENINEGNIIKKELKLNYTGEVPPNQLYIGILNKNNYELEKVYRYRKRNFNLRGTVNDMLVLKKNFSEAKAEKLNSTYSFVSCGEYAHFNRMGTDGVKDANGTGWFSTARLNKDITTYGGIIPFSKKITVKFTTIDGAAAENISLYLAPKEIYAGSTERSPEYINLGGVKWSTDEILGLPYDETKAFPKLESLTLSSWPKENYAGTPSKSGWVIIFEYGLIMDNSTLERIISEEKRMIEVITEATIPLFVFTNASWNYSTTYMNLFNVGEIKTNLLSKRSIIMSAVGEDYLETGSISSTEIKYPSSLDLKNLSDIEVVNGSVKDIVKTADKYTANYISASGVSEFRIEILRNGEVSFKKIKWNGEGIKATLKTTYAENNLNYYEDTINIDISALKEYEEGMSIKADGYNFPSKYENKEAVYTIYDYDNVKLGNNLKEGKTIEYLNVTGYYISYKNDFNLKEITIKGEKGTTKNIIKDKDRNAIRYTSPSGASEFILELVKDFNLGKTKIKLTVNKWNEEEIKEVFNITGMVTEKILLNISPPTSATVQEGSATISFGEGYTAGEIAYYSNNSMNNTNVSITDINNFMESSILKKYSSIDILDENNNIVLQFKKEEELKSFQISGIKVNVGINKDDKFTLSLDEWRKDIQGNIKVNFKNEQGKSLGNYEIRIIPPVKNYTVHRILIIRSPNFGGQNNSTHDYFYKAAMRRAIGTPDGYSDGEEYSGTMSFDFRYTDNVEIESITDLDGAMEGLSIANNNVESKASWKDTRSNPTYNTYWGIGKKGNAPAVILQLTSSRNNDGSVSYLSKFRIIAKDEGVRYVDNVYFGYPYADSGDAGIVSGITKINILPSYNGELLTLSDNEIIPRKATLDKTSSIVSQSVILSADKYTVIQDGKTLYASSTMSDKVNLTVKDKAGKDIKINLGYSNNNLQFSVNNFEESIEKINFDVELYSNSIKIAKQTLDISFPEYEEGSANIKFADTYVSKAGLQRIGGAESSNDLVTISAVTGIYPISTEVYEKTEKIEVLNNGKTLGEVYIGNTKSYELENGSKIKLQGENGNINLGLESWKSGAVEEITVLLKKSTEVVLGRYKLNITMPKTNSTTRKRIVRLQNIKDLKIDTRYYFQQNEIKTNSSSGWGNAGDMGVNITDYEMLGDYIYYPSTTNFPTFKFALENNSITNTISSAVGAYVQLASNKMEGELSIDITSDKNGAIYPQLYFSGKVKEAFKESVTITYNDGTNYYEDELTIIIPETSAKEEGSAKLKFNNAYNSSEGYLKIIQREIDPAYGELSMYSGTFPPTIGDLSDNFEILSGNNKVAESSNMEIVEAVLENMTLRTGYIDGKLNLMIYDWIPRKEDTIELILKNGTTEKGRYTLRIEAPREGIETISGSDILNFGAIIRGNKEVSRSSTWLTVDIAEELEISTIKADMSDPYIYLNGINSTEEANRIKILKIEAKGSKNRYEKTYYDLTVEGELEAVKADQKEGSYEGSITLEMYIK